MPRYMNLKTGIPCATLAAVLSLLCAPAARADSSDQAPTRRVNFADLNLAHREGVAALYARISGAAREVCTPADSAYPELLRLVQECKEQTIARAVADVDAPALTSYYQATKLNLH